MKTLTIVAVALAGLALLAACASLGGAEAAVLGGAGEEEAEPAWVAAFNERWQETYQALGDRIEELATEATETAAERAAEITRLQGAVTALEERVEHQQTITAEIYTEAEAAKERIRQALEYLSGAAVNDTPAVEAAQETES